MNPRSSERQLSFSGTILAVQPRVFVQRSPRGVQELYQGYLLRIAGVSDVPGRVVRVGIREADQVRHALRAGDRVEGVGKRVRDRGNEVAQLHRIERLRVLERGSGAHPEPPPWLGVPEPLHAYRRRGFRRLDERAFEARCLTCVWACEMAVEEERSGVGAGRVDWRTEPVCFGPEDCRLYRA